MREDGAGLVAPVCVFESGERVGGQIGPTRGGSVPSALLEEGNEVANLDDSSLMGKRIERPLLSRGNTGLSLAKQLGVVVLAFPHLKPTATSWPEGGVLEEAFPHLKPTVATRSERGEGEHFRVRERRAVAASVLLRDAWRGGAALEAQAPLPWLRGAAFGTRTPVAEVKPRLVGTAQLARVPVAKIGPWPMGTAPEARVPVVDLGPKLRGTALAAPVPFDGTAP